MLVLFVKVGIAIIFFFISMNIGKLLNGRMSNIQPQEQKVGSLQTAPIG